jgi:hypothetical protein
MQVLKPLNKPSEGNFYEQIVRITISLKVQLLLEQSAGK